jgi:hypothetical protein
VKWAVDPGLDGDVYAEKPYLYGPLASSLNTLVVGDSSGEATATENDEDEEDGGKGEITKDIGIVVQEGGEGDGAELREEKGVPETEAARKKWFLTEANRTSWAFEKGRVHWGDFFNPYLDFNGTYNCSRLPLPYTPASQSDAISLSKYDQSLTFQPQILPYVFQALHFQS